MFHHYLSDELQESALQIILPVKIKYLGYTFNFCDIDHNKLLWKSTDYEVLSKFKWQAFQRDDLTTVIFTQRYFLLFCSTFLALIWFDHWKVLLSYLHVNDMCEKIRCGQDSAATIHNQKIYFLYGLK